MSTKTLVSVEEYLHTTFDGADREYLDGEVVERNMGNKSHGKIQLRLGSLLQTFEQRTGIYVVVEVRQKVTGTRYRIPDVAVFEVGPIYRDDTPEGQVNVAAGLPEYFTQQYRTLHS